MDMAEDICASSRNIPELLAPAGDWECLRAAVENGADGVYFGFSSHNARMRARNFTINELPKIMEFLHLRGVRGYVALNTLVFTEELYEVAKAVEKIILGGADALLVQDIGLCKVIRQISPDFPIHASTQMTITSSYGVRIARELGCTRIVMSRECSLAEIKKIKQELGADCPELEIFIHGALCVSYSGQCLTSESLGGRSANRGECAQACRMPYELICDGKRLSLGDQRYLLSPKDIVGYELLPQIIDSGISSVKIEGRLKSPEYVACITRIYRDALDKYKQDATLMNRGRSTIPDDVWYKMQMAFPRGFYTGWLDGINNQELVHARFGKKRGVYLGAVSKIHNKKVYLKLASRLSRGDGVVFDCGRPDIDEEGGRVYEIFRNNGQVSDAVEGEYVAISFGRDSIDFKKIHIGDKIWKTSDPGFEREIKASLTTPSYKKPLKMTVYGKNELMIEVEDERGNSVVVKSTIPLSEANQDPNSVLKYQLGRLGGTQFYLSELKNNLAENLILPLSELNRLRREAIQLLEQQRAKPPHWTANKFNLKINHTDDVPKTNPQLIVLVRNLEQFYAALKCEIQYIYCDFEDIRKYDEAVKLAKEDTANCERHNSKVYVACPRIFKDAEEGVLKKISGCGADGFIVRNFAQLEYLSNCVTDFSLNIANPISAEFIMNRWKPQRITVSYDLNIPQIIDLLKAAPSDWFEITLHQHIPMFFMEYCLFCKFLSSGSNWQDCGRPCEKHQLKLRDRVGAEHPIKADVNCRNTVFNALAQTGAESFQELIEAGARWFRIEFVDETPETVMKTIHQYNELFCGKISGKELWKRMKLLNQIGITRGQLLREDNRRGYKAVSWG